MSGLDLKEQLSFQIAFARLWYGNGPFANLHRPSADDKPDPNEDRPFMYLELNVAHRELRRHLGKRPASARIYRDSTGQLTTTEGMVVRGQMTIGELEDEYGVSRGYVEIEGLLPPNIYDAIASSLITSGSELLSRSTLHVGLKEERSKIDFKKQEGPLETAEFFLEDLAITFEVGEQYDDLSDE